MGAALSNSLSCQVSLNSTSKEAEMVISHDAPVCLTAKTGALPKCWRRVLMSYSSARPLNTTSIQRFSTRRWVCCDCCCQGLAVQRLCYAPVVLACCQMGFPSFPICTTDAALSCTLVILPHLFIGSCILCNVNVDTWKINDNMKTINCC